MTSLALVPQDPGVHPALPKLLTKIAGEAALLRKLDSYYTGQQPLAFLSPDVARATMNRLKNLVINWPRLVINSLEERLDVDGFRLAADQPADQDLWTIWQANDLDEASQMCHTDALVHGRAYAIVWDNPDDPQVPLITIESAEQMTVSFTAGTTEVASAVKCWSEDDMAYATLYLPDFIYQYQASLGGPSDVITSPQNWELRNDPIANVHGVVPVVPFFNRPRMTHLYGESELTDVLPLADAVNKLATDMMVSAEYHATPRRWATGIDLGDGEGQNARSREMLRQRWFQASVANAWVSDDPNVRFGQFGEAQLSNFIQAIEMLAAQIASITALPPHYVGLMSQANPASADAIRSAEASLVRRAQRKQRIFGGSWERVMRLALLIRDGAIPPQSRSMETIWRSAETQSVAARIDAATKLYQIGMPFRQTLADLDYTPTAVERIIETKSVDSLTDVHAQLKNAAEIVEEFGFSRAAALAAVGLTQAGQYEAVVEARAPGPGVTTDAELAAEVAAATPVPQPGGNPETAADSPGAAADKAPKPPAP